MALSKGDSLFFQISNRNKKGIYLDIEKEKDVRFSTAWLKKRNVFVTNLRRSTKAKLGIDYDSLRPVNPRIIHANVSGYGPEGPMKDLGAFDPLGLARSGLMYVTVGQNPSCCTVE